MSSREKRLDSTTVQISSAKRPFDDNEDCQSTQKDSNDEVVPKKKERVSSLCYCNKEDLVSIFFI